MPTDPAAHLDDATRRRATGTRARAREALRRLDREGQAINYATVAKTAGVSRSLLYRDTELRAEIDRLRDRTSTAATARQPASQRMSQASRDEILAGLRAEIQGLRGENSLLRARLATALGEERQAAQPPRS